MDMKESVAMKPRSLQQTCGWHIARSFTRKVWHLNITRWDDRFRLVGFLVCFSERYSGTLSPWGIQDQLYKSLISSLRSRLNPPVFLTAMLVFCPKVTIDQIAMVAERRHQSAAVGSGLEFSQEECWAMLEVLSEYQKQQSQSMNLGKKEKRENFKLPTRCLVLEGVYFHDPDFLSQLLKKMPDLCHISLQYNGAQEVMQTLSKYSRDLESLCFLEPCIEDSLLEEDIFPIFFGIPPLSKLQSSSSLIKKFADQKEFREKFVFQFPNLRKLDIDELFFDEDVIHDIYTFSLLLQPKLVCFGKHTGLTKRILTNYKKIWSIINGKPENEAALNLAKAKFVDSVSVMPSDGAIELKFLEEMVPMFKNLVSVGLQKSFWNERDVAKFCHLFANQVKTFSLGELPLSDMSCLSNVTHLRLTLRRHYSFDKMHLILDSCPNLKTLSIHPTFYHEESRRHLARPDQLMNLEQMMEEDRDVFERLMFAEIMGEVADMQAMMNDVGEQNQNEHLFPWAEIPPMQGREAVVNDVPLLRHKGVPKQNLKKHHNLITLRIASLCEAGRKPSEDFLRGLFERLPNLRHLCLGMWMGSLSLRRQFLTCTANALVSVVTDRTLKGPLLPLLEQLCCLPSGTEQQMCQSLASLVRALPSLHTLVLPALDNFMLAPTLRYFQHTCVDIQYKCATDQVFSYWEPEH